jgi:hypothetical protein
MKKEFVPFELALKLKELGFDESCFGYYSKGVLSIEIIKSGKIFTNEDTIYFDKDSSCLAPTFSQAFRWFRDEHGVSIYVCPLEDGSAFYHMVYTNINVPFSNRICSLPSKWNTYEEAELACLDKLIEIVETKQQETHELAR